MKFNLAYAVIGMYCNYAMKKSLRSIHRYLDSLGDIGKVEAAV